MQILLDYLCEQMPSVAEEIRACKACVLIPERESLTGEEKSGLIRSCSQFAGIEKDEVALICYREEAYIINYDVYQGYYGAECPVVLYSNIVESDRKFEKGDSLHQLNFGLIMAKIEEAEMERFCRENNCDYSAGSVYRQFELHWRNMRRGAILNMVFLVFQCILEICLITAIVHLEFEAHRLEIILKKIMGYSGMERIGKQMGVTLISGAAGMIGAVILYVVMDFAYLAYTCIVIGTVMALEIAMINLVFAKNERESIQKTLKGGFL